MSRKDYTEHRCGECGAVTFKQPFVCDACGKVIEKPLEEERSFGTPPPEGWILVRRVGDDMAREGPMYCSWACVQAHAEAVALAKE